MRIFVLVLVLNSAAVYPVCCIITEGINHILRFLIHELSTFEIISLVHEIIVKIKLILILMATPTFRFERQGLKTTN